VQTSPLPSAEARGLHIVTARDAEPSVSTVLAVLGRELAAVAARS
jgi:hypothetical protein